MDINDFGVEPAHLGSDPRLWPLAWKKFANAYAEEYRVYYLVRACGNRPLLEKVNNRVVQYRQRAYALLNWRSIDRFEAKVTRIREGLNKPIKEV